MSEFLDKQGLSYLWGKIKQITPEGGSAYVPTLNAAPTSSTTTYTKDEQTVDFEIGQFARVAKQGGGYDFYQLYDLVTESNVTTATWVKAEYEGGKQDTITANGILKGNGSGGVTAAVSGTDYVAPISGKGLSTNDYTTDDKNKLAGIEEGAEVNVQSDWNATSGDAFIQNKPVIPQLPSPSFNGHQYVDLGLPSGTLWATMNVGAASETDYGNYYRYGMGSKTYDSADTPYAGTEDPLDLSKDTARVVWGGSWHMPTREQMQELTANTTYQWVTNYKGSGINGGTFTATNGAVLFFPAAGVWYDGSQYDVGDYGYYWGSSPDGSNRAYYLGFSNGGKDVGGSYRKNGYSVRPVINLSNTLHKVSVTGNYNDLNNKPTIPSQTAVKGNAESSYRTGNVNITPTDIGLGNVGNFKAVSTEAEQGLSDTEKNNARTNIGAGTSSFSGNYYALTIKPVIPDVMGDDAARANWGGDWRMPTVEEFQALGAAVNTAWTQVNNVYGILCTDKTDSSKTLFFPAAGNCIDGSVGGVGDNGSYWSRSLKSDSRQYAYDLYFGSLNAYWDDGSNRYFGFTVRSILDGTNANGHDYVEIGGIKWATMNIGASSISDYGLYFAWGDTQGYTASQVGSGEGQKYFGWADYRYGNCTDSPDAAGMAKYNETDNLTTLELPNLEYLHKVAVTGNYNDLSNKPTIPTVYDWAKAPTKPSYTASEVGISSSVQPITSNTSSSCSITGSSNDGKSQTIIYTNSTSSDLTVTVPTTYKTPDGAAIELTCKAGGYCEVNYLNISGTIYARGL